MATDVALILTRGRQPLHALTVSLSARRAEDDPHRVVGVQIHFAVGGVVNPAHLDRAVQLSRDKYLLGLAFDARGHHARDHDEHRPGCLIS